MKKLVLIADSNIPHLHEFFSEKFDLRLLDSDQIISSNIQDADILLIRSVTKVDADLLANTSVKFVATATSGIDHLDINYLETHNIPWTQALGCNANAVKNYVLRCLEQLKQKSKLPNTPLRVGVIGIGNVGRLVSKAFKELGFEVLENDPIRAENEKDFHSVSLNDFVNLDLISIHTPLTFAGAHPTFHLIDHTFLQQQKRNCVIINSARGGVLDSEAVLAADHLEFCLDVFENEPDIDLALVKKAFIATPHIAGYSAEAKFCGVEMVARKIMEFASVPFDVPVVNLKPLAAETLSLDYFRDCLLEDVSSFLKLRG